MQIRSKRESARTGKARGCRKRFSAAPRSVVAVNFAFGRLAFAIRPFSPLRLLFPKNLCFANLFREPGIVRFSLFQSVSVTRRVLGSAPEARSAEGDGAASAALVSFAADLFKTSTRLALTPVYLPYIDRISAVHIFEEKRHRKRQPLMSDYL